MALSCTFFLLSFSCIFVLFSFLWQSFNNFNILKCWRVLTQKYFIFFFLLWYVANIPPIEMEDLARLGVQRRIIWVRFYIAQSHFFFFWGRSQPGLLLNVAGIVSTRNSDFLNMCQHHVHMCGALTTQRESTSEEHGCSCKFMTLLILCSLNSRQVDVDLTSCFVLLVTAWLSQSFLCMPSIIASFHFMFDFCIIVLFICYSPDLMR